MTPSSTPITAPIEKVSIVRQGRHAVTGPVAVIDPADLIDVGAAFETGVAWLLSHPAEGEGPSERPLVVKQRIARDRNQLRRLRRALPDLAGVGPRFETEAAIRALTASIRTADQVLDQLVREGRTRRWGPSNFQGGDQTRYLSVWCEVLDVGPLGLTVRPLDRPDGPKVGVEYSKITGRRRNGVENVDAA